MNRLIKSKAVNTISNPATAIEDPREIAELSMIKRMDEVMGTCLNRMHVNRMHFSRIHLRTASGRTGSRSLADGEMVFQANTG